MLIYVGTCLHDVSRRRQRKGNAADNKAESWQVVDLAAVHDVLKIKTTKIYCVRGQKLETNLSNLYFFIGSMLLMYSHVF